MKKPEKKKASEEKELTREQERIDFGKRMNDIVLIPIGKKRKTKKGKK